MADDDDTITKAKGKVEEAAGWAAGDRRAEAKGRSEKETGDEPDEETVEAVEDEVGHEHGDI